MEKEGDLSDIKCGMVLVGRWAGLSNSQTADLTGFPHTTISSVV